MDSGSPENSGPRTRVEKQAGQHRAGIRGRAERRESGTPSTSSIKMPDRRDASGYWRSIARRVRDRAATGSTGPSSAAQPAPPAQILPDAGRNYAPARPDFNAWLETLAYGSGVFASEAVVRTWSIPFPWLDRPYFYRSGLPTRTLAAHFAGTIRKEFMQMHKKLVVVFRQSVRCSVQKLRNHLKPSQRKQRKEERKKHEC
jgi:hypothetical protein